jgi:hypothetical protein
VLPWPLVLHRQREAMGTSSLPQSILRTLWACTCGLCVMCCGALMVCRWVTLISPPPPPRFVPVYVE